MIIVQNSSDGHRGALYGPFENYDEADKFIHLMPYPKDWQVRSVSKPDWEDF